MNNLRRSAIKEVCSRLYDAIGLLESVCNEEEECLYNLPDSLQYGIIGQSLEENIESMMDILDSLVDFTTLLEEM